MPERECLKELGIKGEIILKCILIKLDERVWPKIHLPRAGFCELPNEHSGSIKFLD